MRPLVPIMLACATMWLSLLIPSAQGYPMIVEVAEQSKRCVRLTIPQDDDANVVFVAVPGLAAEEDEENPNWVKEQREMEGHFVFQMSEMQKYRVRSTLPRKFPTTPSDAITKLMNKFLNEKQDGELKSGCIVTVSNHQSSVVRSMESFWFTPLVMNHLRKTFRGSGDMGRNSNPLEGYEFCFENSSEDAPVQMIVESVLLSDPIMSNDADGTKKKVFEPEHLTPLAEQLAESIDSAESVLKEMRYMEGRERRMRQTSDSINSRVRYFSYISVSVLLVVTYIQVTYLKRYFRKKKLL